MYEFVVRYKKNTIKTLTRVQANLYCWKQMAALLALGLSLAGTGIAMVERNRTFMVFVALGCWLCISVNYPAQYFARQISKGMGDEEKEFLYRFAKDGVEVICGPDRNYISYEKIQKIVDAGDSVCFFLGRNAGFLISKSGLESPAACAAFLDDLKQYTGVPVEKDVPLLLRLLRLRFQKKSSCARQRTHYRT